MDPLTQASNVDLRACLPAFHCTAKRGLPSLCLNQQQPDMCTQPLTSGQSPCLVPADTQAGCKSTSMKSAYVSAYQGMHKDLLVFAECVGILPDV